MLAEVEALAAQVYGSATSNEQRAEAERQLSVFSSNPDMLDQARMILETSQQSYAQHLAATAMSKLLTAHWGRFSAQQRIDMRSYVCYHSSNPGPILAPRWPLSHPLPCAYLVVPETFPNLAYLHTRKLLTGDHCAMVDE